MSANDLFLMGNAWDACTALLKHYSKRADASADRMREHFGKSWLVDAIDPETGRAVIPFDPSKQPGTERLAGVVERAARMYGLQLAELIEKHGHPADFEAMAVQADSPLLAVSPAIRKGQKLTRALPVLVRQAVPHFSDSEASHAANVVVNGDGQDGRPGTVVLSANPVDVLMASESAAFTSCHRLDGEYRAGTSQYAVCGQTAVAYFYSEERAYEPLKAKMTFKTWRQMVFFDTRRKSVAFARVYQSNALPESAHSLVRRAAAHALWRALGKDGTPEWTVNRKTFEALFVNDYGDVEDNDDRDEGDERANAYLAYRDEFNAKRQCCWIVLKQPAAAHPKVCLPRYIPCPSCQGPLDNNAYLVCDDCRCNKHLCAQCNAKVPERRVMWVDDHGYCVSCFNTRFFTCQCCNRRRRRETSTTARNANATVQVCAECLASRRAAPCVQCSTVWVTSQCREAAGGYHVCPDCQPLYRDCPCCGNFCLAEAHFANDSLFCTGCHKGKLIGNCADCNNEAVRTTMRQYGESTGPICLGCRVLRRAEERARMAANSGLDAGTVDALNQLLAAQAESA